MPEQSNFATNTPSIALVQTTSNTGKWVKTGQDVNSLLTVVDRIVNPQNYPAQSQQPQPQPVKKSGIGWLNGVLLTAAGVSLVWGAKKFYEEEIKPRKKGKK